MFYVIVKKKNTEKKNQFPTKTIQLCPKKHKQDDSM